MGTTYEVRLEMRRFLLDTELGLNTSSVPFLCLFCIQDKTHIWNFVCVFPLSPHIFTDAVRMRLIIFRVGGVH